MRSIIVKYKTEIQFIVSLIILLSLMHFTGIGCPIKYLTGISCGGCGMTRALFYACTLRIEEAFYYHPLWPVIPVCLLVYFLRKRIPKKVLKIAGVLLLCVFLMVYLYRLFTENTLITFNPKEGLIYRVVKRFAG